MLFSKSHIHLDAVDLALTTAFYEALLGSPPCRRSAEGAVFELDSPPLVLTLAQQHSRRPRKRTVPRFALIVNEPAHVGHAAIALRRAGMPLRLQDQGIEARDPDGNAWHVRFVPSANGRSVVTSAEADSSGEAPR
jgi:catechol-2,3-dioxygenase